MSPDLNSLPSSRSTSSSPFQARNMQGSSEDSGSQSPPPRSSSVSLQAAATINAADLSHRSSTRSPQANRAAERRRSVVAMNLNFNDPTIPGPGELSSSDHRSSLRGSFTHSPPSFVGSPAMATGDPHHHRTPSLGEIHQELEQEQEAQVNRLLLMIRNQQAQLQQMQQLHQQQGSGSATGAVEDSTPTSERSASFPYFPPLPQPISGPDRRSSLQFPSTRSSRRDSDNIASSAAYPTGSQSEYGLTGAEWVALGGDGAGRRCSRDESAFYQAETANLTRENQMLRHRIRELERQISELTASSPHMPVAPSNLTSSTSAEAVPPPPDISERQPPQTSSGETGKE
ncbi:hypothetical protein PRK78_002650 [Emydomyces testavorans]|uniref:Uncharacterized protein n=1 Tax=Emydomyces testavorans TaxID=2070801 RepID=A0AAF0DFB2_9EURO|nr:hypothetical protein PRK78_002650 [Emydomyces testavorans]